MKSLLSRGTLVGTALIALSAVFTPASALPSAPSLGVTDVHYTMTPSGPTTYGLSTVSFRLQANSSTSVTAWFNDPNPPAGEIYPCAQSNDLWTCTARSSAAEQDVESADRLYVKVDGDTQVLGRSVTRPTHRNGAGTADGQSDQSSVLGEQANRGGLPFTGAYLFAELMAGATLIVTGSVFLRLGLRRRRAHAA